MRRYKLVVLSGNITILFVLPSDFISLLDLERIIIFSAFDIFHRDYEVVFEGQ